MKLNQMSNSTPVAIATNSAIPLGTIDRRDTNGDCNVYSTNANSITINKPGYYLVTVNANIVSTAAGNLSIGLFENSILTPTASASIVSLANSIYSLGFSKIIRVLPNCQSITTNIPKTITVNNIGVAGTLQAINVSVIKIN